jgi:hypothetical protein
VKVIVAGSRDIEDEEVVAKAIADSGFFVSEVVCGESRGVDTIGRRWAEARGLPVESFPAKWDTYGLDAGPFRNALMAEYGDALVLVWYGDSKGSRDMRQRAYAGGLMVFEVVVLRPV